MSDVDLEALTRRVTDKLIAANQAAHPWLADMAESWAVPQFSYEAPQLPEDWPQFPREQWAILPARRAVALTLADRLIDDGKLSEAGWLVAYGGKTRIS